MKVTEVGGQAPTNGAAKYFEMQSPYSVTFTLWGSCDLLFHRWNPEPPSLPPLDPSIKNPLKYDNLESMIYRMENGNLAIPGEYVRGSIIEAARFFKDPRSPRKSARDLYKAGIIALTQYADLGIATWDYEDRRRALIQRAAINRTRPAIKAGWSAEFQFLIQIPEYVSPQIFHEVLIKAGQLVGIADFRPTYGRFQVKAFAVDES